MNYIWNFVDYFYGDNELEHLRDIIHEFTKRNIKVKLIPDELVKEGKSGKVEVCYNNKKIVLTWSKKHQECFTMGGNGMPPFGSKRHKDQFYDYIQMQLT